MTKIQFSRVEVKAQRKGKCDICGKRWTKTKTFWHSVNPFNTRDDGVPKSRAEVLADVQAEAEAWQPQHCKGSL